MSDNVQMEDSNGFIKLEEKLEKETKEMNEELAKNVALKSDHQALFSELDKCKRETNESLKTLNEAKVKMEEMEVKKEKVITLKEKAKEDLLNTGRELLNDLLVIEEKRQKLYAKKTNFQGENHPNIGCLNEEGAE